VDGTDAVQFADNYGKTGEGLFGDFDEDGDVDDDDLAVFAGNFGVIDWDAYSVSATATDEDGTYSSNTLEVVDPPASEQTFEQAGGGELSSSVTSGEPVVSQTLSSKKVESVGKTIFAAKAEPRATSGRAEQDYILLRAAARHVSSWQWPEVSYSYSSWQSGQFWDRSTGRLDAFESRFWNLSEWWQDDGEEDDRGQKTKDRISNFELLISNLLRHKA
jgi:hypothetical protein